MTMSGCWRWPGWPCRSRESGSVPRRRPRSARRLVAADPPDLVILDIVLPDMSGWELLRQIRETDNCLVMLLSGRDSDIDKARGLDLGADDYLTKPFSFLEFEARVRALLRRAPVRVPAGGEHVGAR